MDRSIQPPIVPLQELSIPVPVCIDLPNGIPVKVLQAGDNEVVRIDLVIGAGRWQQQQPLQSLFTNRLLREGTRRYTDAEIAERLDYYGAWLELLGAAEHSFVTLYSLNKYLPQTLNLLESMLKEPLFPEHELDVVLDTNLQQFRVNSSKVDFLAHRGLVQAVYGAKHPCGRLVQEEDYARITPEVLRCFYNSYYHSDNLVIFLSGRVTDDCLKRVEALFGKEPFGVDFILPEKKCYDVSPTAEKRIFIHRPDALQSAVRMGMPTLDYRHPDYQKLRVLVTLFGGYFGSRLMSNIREEKGYTYGISAGILSYPGHGVLIINAETANKYVEPLIAEVYREIERLQNEPVGSDELEMVRNYMIGDMCRSYESAFSLADAWIFVHTSGVSDSYFSEALETVKSITADELHELACRYLRTTDLKEVVVGEC